ncbi:hypothetical protein HAX54_025479, partial [Datura stramonium]|nr:hypothetical protein [Datura stramonium]
AGTPRRASHHTGAASRTLPRMNASALCLLSCCNTGASRLSSLSSACALRCWSRRRASVVLHALILPCSFHLLHICSKSLTYTPNPSLLALKASNHVR